MKSYLRSCIFTKAVALGFIVMILLGNAWLVLFLTGRKDGEWVAQSFMVCMIWTILAGFGMGMKMIQNHVQSAADGEQEELDQNSSNQAKEP